MPFKPPLTTEDLHAIGERSGKDPDVKALLWEIKRLHSIVLRAHQAARSHHEGSASTDMIMGWLWNEIKDEPVVQERLAFEREIFGPPVKPGDDD